MTQTRTKSPAPSTAQPAKPHVAPRDVAVLKGRLSTPDMPVTVDDMAQAVRQRRARIGQDR